MMKSHSSQVEYTEVQPVESGAPPSIPLMDDVASHRRYTPEKVAKHSSETDCWIIVGDKVLDMTSVLSTSILDAHARQELVCRAGQDATAFFLSPEADEMKAYLGTLDAYVVGMKQSWLPVWFKGATTLLLHVVDWCSDIGVIVQWMLTGDYWWAALAIGFILSGGMLAAVVAQHQGVPARKLWPYVLGVGPLREACMRPRIFQGGSFPTVFITIRVTETFGEAIPSGALQIYAMVYRGSATKLQIFSASVSVLSAAYGITSCFRDWALESFVQTMDFFRGTAAGLTNFVYVVGDFVWRVFPMALFAAALQFRPWSLTIVFPSILVFEVALFFGEERWQAFKVQFGPPRFILFLVGGFASTASSSLRILLWTLCTARVFHPSYVSVFGRTRGRYGLTKFQDTDHVRLGNWRRATLWISHLARTALNIVLLRLLEPSFYLLIISIAAGIVSTFGLIALTYLKHKFDYNDADIAKDMSRFRVGELFPKDADSDVDRFDEQIDSIFWCW